MPRDSITRRRFLSAAAAATIMPISQGQAAAKYKRSIISSPEGQKALASYAKGVQAMLQLPADDPRNWFRNAFVHLLDCPHGNWWFYVWHRGYLGYFEQMIRSLSGDADFALPYWDWTVPLALQPQPRWGIPDALFEGVLTPTDRAFAPFTENLAVFTQFIKPALTNFWGGLTANQKAQLEARGWKSLDDAWNFMNGSDLVKNPDGSLNYFVGNVAFAPTCSARYFSRANPDFDKDTAFTVRSTTVAAGLLAPNFNDAVNYLSFTSKKTESHNDMDQTNMLSVLESQPHNMVHNAIGGGGPLDPGPYGNITNFLSPVDPIFFLHHANMDRLWDVWTRRQMSLNQPYLPTGDDLTAFSSEPFVFFVDHERKPILDGKAGDYISTASFDYEYDRAGTGERLIHNPSPPASAAVATAKPTGNTAALRVPADAITQANAAQPRILMAQVTIARVPGVRIYRVFVGAPEGAADLGPDSPFFAGAVSFFGPSMSGMSMSEETTFAVPLPPRLPALTAEIAPGQSHANVSVSVVPVGAEGATALKNVAIGFL